MIGQPLRRRLNAGFLGVAAVCAPLALPLLDASEDARATRVESRHDPGSCAALHDHAACKQLAKSFSRLPAPLPVDLPAGSIASRAARPADTWRTSRPHWPAPTPRAPPPSV